MSQLFGCRPLGPAGFLTATWCAVGGTVADDIMPRVVPDSRMASLDSLTGLLDRVPSH